MSNKKESERGRGHPRSFATGKIFEDKAKEYIEQCTKQDKLANIAGFCVFADITKETFYTQEDYYSDSFKKVNQMLEDAALNHKATAMGIFYLKNKFKYRDKVETENVNVNYEMSEEEAEKILSKYNLNE